MCVVICTRVWVDRHVDSKIWTAGESNWSAFRCLWSYSCDFPVGLKILKYKLGGNKLKEVWGEEKYRQNQHKIAQNRAEASNLNVPEIASNRSGPSSS